MADYKTPIYQKIADKIISRIYEGEYPMNSFLPSENELAEEFHVTRTTIRKVLSLLKQQGTIKSYQGRGYKVQSLFWEQSLLKFYSFGKSIASKLENSNTKLISVKEVSGLEDVDEFKNIELWEITRLRLVGEIPLILESSYIPIELLKKINNKNLETKPLYDLLAREGIRCVNAKEYLEPVLPSLEAQELLEIEENIPLFQTTRYTHDSENRLVEFRESLIRADHFRFFTELKL
ncbi:MAG TPA: GntR family transcriptional regulator [Petrotoga sp.]|nr:MAG: Transcriptional regulator, GntR family [Petrotoga mobilis]HBT51744.1 GntR family transcriptional regulator [Petrotoga sp.]